MTRAINLALPEERVQTLCGQKGVKISAIESLPSGGTHLVCRTIEGADEIRRLLQKHLIAGPVRRFAFYRAPPSKYF
ncbi:hypothetical protein OLX02_12225 [Novosphingobium sp. KCTC 2891]|uniref:hypothetical protein n=1 Tax=Novosphingobium sp. KCTC 2891 TaxID=2989730 RepID=UPI0022213F1B|nr:hypothetical protein [Novosphingobium sp. KCTC 2891]MCW1383586.1 hypothetical protein [Novosphingobium sp. KCTC 2891]